MGSDWRHLVGERATACVARPVARRAALQLVGLARYSFSLRLALHPTGYTTHTVQLPFLGLMVTSTTTEPSSIDNGTMRPLLEASPEFCVSSVCLHEPLWVLRPLSTCSAKAGVTSSQNSNATPTHHAVPDTNGTYLSLVIARSRRLCCNPVGITRCAEFKVALRAALRLDCRASLAMTAG